MFRAFYESQNFSFEAYHVTELKARLVLIKGLNQHAKQYGLKRDWYEEESIQSYAVFAGICLRDRQPMEK